MTSAPIPDPLARFPAAWRMGEASARARYSDLDTMPAGEAFRLGHADGAAAVAASFPAVAYGLFDTREWVERLCDPDVVPGTCRPADAGPVWAASPVISPDSVAGQSLAYQARAHAPEAAGLAPLDAYVVGFKRGARAALYVIRQAAAAVLDLADVVVCAGPPPASLQPTQDSPR